MHSNLQKNTTFFFRFICFEVFKIWTVSNLFLGEQLNELAKTFGRFRTREAAPISLGNHCVKVKSYWYVFGSAEVAKLCNSNQSFLKVNELKFCFLAFSRNKAATTGLFIK